MKVEDVTDTLELALQAPGCDQVHVVQKPRLPSDNGSRYVSGDLAVWLGGKGMKHSRGALSSPDTRQDRLSALQATPAGQRRRWHQTLKNRMLLEQLQPPAISREFEKCHTV